MDENNDIDSTNPSLPHFSFWIDQKFKNYTGTTQKGKPSFHDQFRSSLETVRKQTGGKEGTFLGHLDWNRSNDRLVWDCLSAIFPLGLESPVHIADTTIPGTNGIPNSFRNITIRPAIRPDIGLPDRVSICIQFRILNYNACIPVSATLHPDCAAKEFEKACLITPVNRENPFSRSLVQSEFFTQLPKVSTQTREQLEEWYNYLKFRDQYSKSREIHLQIIERKQTGPKEGLLYLTASPEEMQTAIRIMREDGLAFLATDEENSDKSSKNDSVRIGDIKGNYKSIQKGQLPSSLNNDLTNPIYELPFTWDSPFVNATLDPLEKNLSPHGFLTSCQVQNQAINQRHRNLLNSLRDGRSYAPHLPLYLFDINRAHRNQPSAITQWSNPSLTEDQKRAVRMIVNAQDLFLVQGPPGTGKTTVIAECIYQLVQQGKRVLLSSQTHLAVDNALERIQHRHEIRPLRLSSKRQTAVFSKPEDVVEYFYSTLHGKCKSLLQPFADDESEITKIEERLVRLLELEKQISERSGCLKIFHSRQEELQPQYLTAEKILGENEKRIRLISQAEHLELWLFQPETSGSPPESGKLLPELNRYLATILDCTVSLDTESLRKYSSSNLKTTANSSQKEGIRPLQELELIRDQLTDRLMENITTLEREEVTTEIRSVREQIIQAKAHISRLQNNEELEHLQKGQGILLQALKSLREKWAQPPDELDNARRIYGEFQSIENEIQSQKEHLLKLFQEIRECGVSHEETLTSCKTRLLAEMEERKARIESSAYADPDFKCILDDYLTELSAPKNAQRDTAIIHPLYMDHCNVVGITCNENPRTLDENLQQSVFDVAIIDEVSRATPLELLGPMLKARTNILVGDHKQLPPVFSENYDSVGLAELIESEEDDADGENLLSEENFKRFEKFVTASMFKEHFEKAHESLKATLSTQFRMHPHIMQAINQFYEGELICGLKEPDTERNHGMTVKLEGREIISPQNHIVWLDTSYTIDGYSPVQRTSGASVSLSNELEARMTLSLLKAMDNAIGDQGNGKRKQVAVIHLYNGQKTLLWKLMGSSRTKAFRNIEVENDTVDRFQGKEKPIVIVNLVRNKGITRHVTSFERINVAFSRAQELLVILGHQEFYKNIHSEGRQPYQEVLNSIHRNGGLKDSRSYSWNLQGKA